MEQNLPKNITNERDLELYERKPPKYRTGSA